MPNCIARSWDLEPPVCAPYTVYAEELYRVAGQDYCRHHITRAEGAGSGNIFGQVTGVSD